MTQLSTSLLSRRSHAATAEPRAARLISAALMNSTPVAYWVIPCCCCCCCCCCYWWRKASIQEDVQRLPNVFSPSSWSAYSISCLQLSFLPDPGGQRKKLLLIIEKQFTRTIRYETIFNVRSQADRSQLNPPRGTKNKQVKVFKNKTKTYMLRKKR